MMEFFKYLPYIQRLAEHEPEITQLTTLLGPTITELKKVWPQVLPLIAKLVGGLTGPK